jgi:amino acid transporter
MFYMAASLSFTAGGIILLYLLWDAQPVEGQTLNAVTFRAIIDAAVHDNAFVSVAVVVVLLLEGGLLFVAANTGFLGGPAVLANMAVDSWVPHQYRYLSSRLVTQRGILLMGVAAIGILIVTLGRVSLLVVLYSINVFLTFSLSLLGLCIYWWRSRQLNRNWLLRIALSLLGLTVTAGILIITTVEKFTGVPDAAHNRYRDWFLHSKSRALCQKLSVNSATPTGNFHRNTRTHRPSIPRIPLPCSSWARD